VEGADQHKLMSMPAFEPRELRLRADLESLKQARDWAVAVAEDFGLPEDDGFHVRLAMSEAVTNAIVHGSGSESDHVVLGARDEHGMLVFEVLDAGTDTEASQAATRLAEGGRGLELVELVMDEVELLSRGTGSMLRFAKRR
jgi:stage II sporulation protein AB (anti-sigma F factor)